MTKARDLASIPAGSGDFSLTGDLVFASGQGIDFSATSNSSGTMSSELFDDYEEGTWTPQVLGSTSGTTTYSAQNGTYTKIGRMVSLSGYVAWTAATGSGVLRIYGLPFPTGTGANYYSAGSVFMNNIDIPTSAVTPVLFADSNLTYMPIYYSRDNSTWTTQPMDSAGNLIFQITYHTS